LGFAIPSVIWPRGSSFFRCAVDGFRAPLAWSIFVLSDYRAGGAHVSRAPILEIFKLFCLGAKPEQTQPLFSFRSVWRRTVPWLRPVLAPILCSNPVKVRSTRWLLPVCITLISSICSPLFDAGPSLFLFDAVQFFPVRSWKACTASRTPFTQSDAPEAEDNPGNPPWPPFDATCLTPEC